LPDSFREAEFAILKSDLAPSSSVVHIDGGSVDDGANSYVIATQAEAKA